MTSAEPTPVTPITTSIAPSTPPTTATGTGTTGSSPRTGTPTTEPTPASGTPATATAPGPDPDRPQDPAQAALFDAIANENAVIFGYGIVSAHSAPEINALVSESLLSHRARRENALALATRLDSPVPLPAVGYTLPTSVNTPTDAARLAVRMEEDCTTAWRVALEQADSGDARKTAVAAMTDSAVLAARWRAQLDLTPVTVAFPGGTE